MKFLSLLFLTIIIGAIGMSEYKIKYPQPDRNENLVIKEIITGTLYKNLVDDASVGIAPFERYQFPLDIKKTGSLDINDLSDGKSWAENFAKLKERAYLPLYAIAKEENPQTLNMLPFMQNLRLKGDVNHRGFTFVNFNNDGDPYNSDTKKTFVEGFPDLIYEFSHDRGSFVRYKYKDEEHKDADGFALVVATNSRLLEKDENSEYKYSYMDYDNGVVPEEYINGNRDNDWWDYLEEQNTVAIFTINASGEIVKTIKIPFKLSYTDSGETYPRRYKVQFADNYEDDLYVMIDYGLFSVKYDDDAPDEGQIVPVLYERDEEGVGTAWNYGGGTYRYLQLYKRDSNQIDYPKIYDKKLKVMLDFTDMYGLGRINPVLGTIAFKQYNGGNNKLFVYSISSGSRKTIIEGITQDNKMYSLYYKRYYSKWCGNLKYDYLLSDNSYVVGRGNFPLYRGLVDTNNAFNPRWIAKSLVGSSTSGGSGNNTDDYTFNKGWYGDGISNIYTSDGETFKIIPDGEYFGRFIRTWVKEKTAYVPDSNGWGVTVFEYE